MALLEVHNLVKAFGGLKANDDVSFTLEKGELLGLIGPNGADERNKRSTISLPATSENIWTFYANVDRDTFSLAGFQRFCK